MDFTFNIFLQLFISNVQVVTNMSSGVTSNSKYTTYGSLRIGGQILSQEIIIGTSTLAILLASNTLGQNELIEYQFDVALILSLFTIYLSYLICILGETTRAPFDLVESESELVAGFNTEYPTVYFSLFFMAEYSNIIALSEVASISFYCSYESISFSTNVHAFTFVNLRCTFPRYRQDQLMCSCWCKHQFKLDDWQH